MLTCIFLYPFTYIYVCVCALSHVWLYRLMNCSPLGSSVRGIFQAKLLRWVVISFSGYYTHTHTHTHTHIHTHIFIFKMCVCVFFFFAEYSNWIVQFDQIWNFCPLVEEFRLLTFKWVIDATGLICTISVTIFYLLSPQKISPGKV